MIVGPENSLLPVVLKAVLAGDTRSNPIFLVGPSAVGKSHFALGLAARYRLAHPDHQVLVATCSDFARSHAAAVELDSLPEFRQTYRSPQLLILENLDEISSKHATQVELLHAFDSLAERQHLLVMTSRRELADSFPLVPALRSRLLGGLMVPVAPPAVATRRAILLRLAALHSLVLSERVVEILAEGTERTPSPLHTYPELQGAILQLTAFRQTDRTPIDTMSALQVISGPRFERQPNSRDIAKLVARHFHLRLNELTGSSRRQAVTMARGLAVYLARRFTHSSYEQLGKAFGSRDHTTVLHACRRTEQRLASDRELKLAAERISSQLRRRRPSTRRSC